MDVDMGDKEDDDDEYLVPNIVLYHHGAYHGKMIQASIYDETYVIHIQFCKY